MCGALCCLDCSYASRACSKYALSHILTLFLILQTKNLKHDEMTSLGQGHTASGTSVLFGLCDEEGTRIALFWRKNKLMSGNLSRKQISGPLLRSPSIQQMS